MMRSFEFLKQLNLIALLSNCLAAPIVCSLVAAFTISNLSESRQKRSALAASRLRSEPHQLCRAGGQEQWPHWVSTVSSSLQ